MNAFLKALLIALIPLIAEEFFKRIPVRR